MATLYDKTRAIWSRKAHNLAEKNGLYSSIYPNASKITFECTDMMMNEDDKRCQILDGELKIDYIGKIIIPNHRFYSKMPRCVYIQERWRRPEHRHYRQVTLTEFNRGTNIVSELFTIGAQFMLYGYCAQGWGEETESPKDPLDITEAIYINVGSLIEALINGTIHVVKADHGRKDQDFVGFNFNDLRNSGIARWYYRDGTIENYHTSFKSTPTQVSMDDIYKEKTVHPLFQKAEKKGNGNTITVAEGLNLKRDSQ